MPERLDDLRQCRAGRWSEVVEDHHHPLANPGVRLPRPRFPENRHEGRPELADDHAAAHPPTCERLRPQDLQEPRDRLDPLAATADLLAQLLHGGGRRGSTHRDREAPPTGDQECADDEHDRHDGQPTPPTPTWFEADRSGHFDCHAAGSPTATKRRALGDVLAALLVKERRAGRATHRLGLVYPCMAERAAKLAPNDRLGAVGPFRR